MLATVIAKGRDDSVPVVYGLHVVAVEVAQKHAVVARVVLGPLPRGVQHLRPRRHRGVVDRVHGAAVTAGTEVLHAPREWPEYHPGYYGVFLRDLDGHNVEAVYHGD